MKTKNIFKTLAFAMMMPAMLLTTACSSEDELANNKNIDNTEAAINKGFSLPVTVNVTRQGESDMRATFNDETKKLSFSAGDKLFVGGNYDDWDKSFAGTLDYDAESGKFKGTIYTQDDTYKTYEDLFGNSDYTIATLLPAGYKDHGYLVINTKDPDAQYDDFIEESNEYTLATSKADGVAQFSYEKTSYYNDGFALSPDNAILNFTITGLAASTSVNVSLTSMAYKITGTVTTDASGNATFAAGIMGGLNLQPFSLTVAGNPITLVSSDKVVEEGMIYNIKRAVTPPTLAQTMTTAGMTVKVKYNYHDEENYCLFSSVGDGTYTFQSGYGYAGGDDCAKALVVEGGKLVFKQNFFDTIDDQWSNYGFSATFDTSNNSYKQFVGPWVQQLHNPSLISVEVNSVPIALTKIITVADLVKEDGDSWSDIIAKNSDKIKAESYYVVRISDNAKLQRNMWGDDWQDVDNSENYSSMDTYKFEGD